MRFCFGTRRAAQNAPAAHPHVTTYQARRHAREAHVDEGAKHGAAGQHLGAPRFGKDLAAFHRKLVDVRSDGGFTAEPSTERRCEARRGIADVTQGVTREPEVRGFGQANTGVLGWRPPSASLRRARTRARVPWLHVGRRRALARGRDGGVMADVHSPLPRKRLCKPLGAVSHAGLHQTLLGFAGLHTMCTTRHAPCRSR